MKYAKRYRFVIVLFLLAFLCGGVIVRGTSDPFLTTYAGMLSHAILRYAFMMLILFADYLFYTAMHVTGYIMRKKSFLQCKIFPCIPFPKAENDGIHEGGKDVEEVIVQKRSPAEH